MVSCACVQIVRKMCFFYEEWGVSCAINNLNHDAAKAGFIGVTAPAANETLMRRVWQTAFAQDSIETAAYTFVGEIERAALGVASLRGALRADGARVTWVERHGRAAQGTGVTRIHNVQRKRSGISLRRILRPGAAGCQA